ncbi:hypothetical protein H696_04551 [Fonticula alba]|uniref:WSC domain-containing protein n=1 Tax=Fonticula alba TaxID=691883 RepID=A0A058Z4S9_FONAL|nr:hypothetical protein H696_04551 [Fonticula alba]KCV69136.1 hypothetical protein H696_04551 [Fonticula alba]|eukprot:XP_009496707.1 hypothetical protein H696_04551 [Fonticula alba]
MGYWSTRADRPSIGGGPLHGLSPLPRCSRRMARFSTRRIVTLMGLLALGTLGYLTLLGGRPAGQPAQRSPATGSSRPEGGSLIRQVLQRQPHRAGATAQSTGTDPGQGMALDMQALRSRWLFRHFDEHSPVWQLAVGEDRTEPLRPAIPGLEDAFLGCFADRVNGRIGRALPTLVDPAGTGHLKPPVDPVQCLGYCRDQGFAWAGLQNGTECWCGSPADEDAGARHPRYRHYSAHEPGLCSVECPFLPGVACGGPLANSVYAVGPAAAPEPVSSQAMLQGNAAFGAVLPQVRVDAGSDVERFLPSDIDCMRERDGTRLCLIRNLYFNVDQGTFVLLLSQGRSVVRGLDDTTRGEFQSIVQFSTVSNAYKVDLKIMDHGNIRKYPKYTQLENRIIRGRSYLLARFLPYNLMHTIHDDLLGLLHTMDAWQPRHGRTPAEQAGLSHTVDRDLRRVQEAPGPGRGLHPDVADELHRSLPFDHNIILFDDHAAGDYLPLLQLFSDRKVMSFVDFPRGSLIRFEEASMGLSRKGTWYHYGFNSPQGPLPHKNVAGPQVTSLMKLLNLRLGLAGRRFPGHHLPSGPASSLDMGAPSAAFCPEVAGSSVPSTGVGEILILGRSRDRRILNEIQLTEELARETGLCVAVLRLENVPFFNVSSLKSFMTRLAGARIIVAMHGAALALAALAQAPSAASHEQEHQPGGWLVEATLRDHLLLEAASMAASPVQHPRGPRLPTTPGGVIELFPFGVQPENYTPYMHECRIAGCIYRAWANSDRRASVPHPKRAPLKGGIVHLPPAEQRNIEQATAVPPHICCSDPTWLYKIYQDTIVDQTRVAAIAREILQLQLQPQETEGPADAPDRT